ncbi:MAG: hypothetical protein JWP31_1685, partial [Aeromicrobium sp.]|nr:hypothetical protein [Aeromicrobium sp.]
MIMPMWGRAAKRSYKLALGAFFSIWILGLVLGVDPDDSSRLYVVWLGTGALGFVALLTWLAAEFVTGRQETGE